MLLLFLIVFLLLIRRLVEGIQRLILTVILSLLPMTSRIEDVNVLLFLLMNLVGNICFHIGFGNPLYTMSGITCYGLGHLVYFIGRELLMINLEYIIPMFFLVLVYGCLLQYLYVTGLASFAVITFYFLSLELNLAISQNMGVILYMLGDTLVVYEIFIGELPVILSILGELLYYSALLFMAH